jgi:DNA-binding GntR family transcriptional regulator
MPPKKGRNLSTDQQFSVVVDQLAGGYKTIGEMVYAVLREAILSGAFAPGEWLRQESLADAIGVSRIPVRTALLRLESEGLINFHPHRGARVRTLTPTQVNEIYRLRTLLETYALRLSAETMTPERLSALETLARQLDRQPEGSEFLDVRVRFYQQLYDAERNTLLVQMIDDLRSHVGRYLLSLKFERNHHHQHTDLVEKISRGDLAAAESWLVDHLEEIREAIAELTSEGLDDADVPSPAQRPQLASAVTPKSMVKERTPSRANLGTAERKPANGTIAGNGTVAGSKVAGAKAAGSKVAGAKAAGSKVARAKVPGTRSSATKVVDKKVAVAKAKPPVKRRPAAVKA